MQKSVVKILAERVTAHQTEQLEDALAVEEPLEIRISHGAGKQRRRLSVAVTMRTPGEDEDLATGFLFTEGIIQDARQILTIKRADENTLVAEFHPAVTVDEERLTRHLFTTSSCGVCGKASLDAVQTVACHFPKAGRPILDRKILYGMPATLRQAQGTFDLTGGLHAAGLFDAEGKLLLLREDIGRHNAVDKTIGAALRAGWSLPFSDQILLVSGRAGFELVQKAAMAGIPLLAAVGAPSSLSAELANQSGMTLVGFLRGERFNIYAHPGRIKTQT